MAQAIDTTRVEILDNHRLRMHDQRGQMLLHDDLSLAYPHRMLNHDLALHDDLAPANASCLAYTTETQGHEARE